MCVDRPPGPFRDYRVRRGVSAVVYVPDMRSGAEARSYGKVFDRIADEYDRHRPTYPDELVDAACETAAIAPGDRVLEVGCGTGQLTRSLLARGLRVTAVEPGEQLIGRAREQLAGLGDVEFVNAPLERTSLAAGHYSAAFSASAIHWVDPDVGWRHLADALVDRGTLALISYVGLEESRTADDQRAVRAAIETIAPALASEWPVYRKLDEMAAGAAERRGNVSDVWSWLGSYDLARGYASELFSDARLTAVPSVVEHTAGELNALLATMSFWSRLSDDQRRGVGEENGALGHRLGRPIRSSIAACLVTAQRVSRT
jgi:SAM-dependent methyltransferase